MTDIFTQDFQRVDVNAITQALKEKGYFCFERAITEETITLIERDSSQSRLNINNNKVSGVYYEKQYYLTNLLCVSKTFYDFVTSKLVFNICNKYLGNEFRLKAMRYYETYGGHHMRWHTDNKNDRGFINIPGIIFIFYVSDVTDGEFQYIEGSHNWSGDKAYSEYSDEFVENNHTSKIKDFKLPRGSLIIYNTYGIHRAKPVLNNKFVRKSVFFQIDGDINNSEPIFLNTQFITKIDRQLEMFLGFGRPATNDVFPQTSLSTLPISRPVFYMFLKYIPYRLMRYIFDNSPKSIKKTIRGLSRKNRPSVLDE